MTNKIQIKQYTKAYRGKYIYTTIDLEIEAKNITLLLGDTGVGKSTLLNSIAHNVENYEGEILLNNELKYSKLKDILLIPEKQILPVENTLEQLMSLFIQANDTYDKEYVLTNLEEVKIDIKAKVKSLSNEEREIAQFILLSANKPKFLLLDEPFILENKIRFAYQERTTVDSSKKEFLYKKIEELNKENIGIIIAIDTREEIEDVFSQIIVLENNTLSEITKNFSLEEVQAMGYKNIKDYREDLKAGKR